MNDVIFAGGGYMLMLRYTHQQRDMLMVAKLNPQSGAIFSDDLDKVVRAPYLNLDRLQVAARIDLAAWLAGGERYLSFVLKKNKDEGPSDYFQDFVGCKVDQDSKVESKKLVLVVKDFASSLVDAGAMPAGDVPDLQRRAFDYVEGLRKSESPRLDDFEGWPMQSGPMSLLRSFTSSTAMKAPHRQDFFPMPRPSRHCPISTTRARSFHSR